MSHFIIKFKIPWILKWQYGKEGDILDRHWFVKCWDKFPQATHIIEVVNKDFAKKTASSMAPLTVIAAKLITPEEKNYADVTSPSSSKTKQSKKKKKCPSKKEMDMLTLLLKSLRDDNDDKNDDNEEDEEEEKSETSSSSSHGFLFGHDPLCSQDPVSGIDDILELDY